MALILALCFISAAVGVSSQPIELNDSFLNTRKDIPWLVEFYAPWCGHCRKLEPIYHQVFLTLREQGSPIKVAKVDATRFSSISNEFSVRGFPTIKFIQGSISYTHHGERSRESIIEFAKRALGPRVRSIANKGKFYDVKGEHADGVFFMYVGDQDSLGDLVSKYKNVADKYAVLSYFYSGEKKALPEDVKIKHEPTVLVLKDGTHYEFPQSEKEVTTKKDLDDFVNSERFTIFPKAGGGTLNEMSDLNKKLVIVVTDETEKHSKPRQERLKEMSKLLIVERRKELHPDFQFLWMGEKETADSITMSSMDNPSIFVLDPATHLYYLPPQALEEMTRDDFFDFLMDVQNGKVEANGGTGFLQRIKRLFYDIYTTLLSLYEHSGWLALIVLGVPMLVISIVCYALCCMEPFDDSIMERQGEDGEETENRALTEEGIEEEEEGDGDDEDEVEEDEQEPESAEKSDTLKKTE